MLILRLAVILLIACVVFGGLFFELKDNNILELVSQVLALLTEVAGTSISMRGLLKK